MKKILFLLMLCGLTASAFSQVFNTAGILKRGQFSAGINPVMNGEELGLFVHGGYGISENLDVAAKFGITEGYDYLGADVEWSLRNTERLQISLTGGGHVRANFGLDAGASLSFPLLRNTYIFS